MFKKNTWIAGTCSMPGSKTAMTGVLARQVEAVWDPPEHEEEAICEADQRIPNDRSIAGATK